MAPLLVDYIVVGAGSAGCVLADRLSFNGRHKVLLLEAGPTDRNPAIHMPKGYGALLYGSNLVWKYQTDEEPGNGHQKELWLRGRVLGGSSSVNGMVYSRGQAQDYDDLATATNEPAWSWQSMSQIYETIEDHELGAGEGRGTKGALRISCHRGRTPVCDALIDAGASIGLTVKNDLNGTQDIERIGYVQRTISDGRRQSAAVAFLKPAKSRPNLLIKTGVEVSSIIFVGNRASGAAAVVNGKYCEFHAKREVILCAGAINSPTILQRSGIGDRDLLDRFGIRAVFHSPNVGRNLREHRLIFCQYRLKKGISYNNELQGTKLVGNVVRYLVGRRGVLADGAYDIGAFIKTDPSKSRPDAQLLISPFSLVPEIPDKILEKKPGIQCIAYLLRPQSQGYIQISSSDPGQAPRIVPNYLSAPPDRAGSVNLLSRVRDLFSQSSVAQFIEEETSPGKQCQSDSSVIDAYGRCGGSGYHASGTCAMGLDDEAVLDGRLRVRGVAGLRVVDCSSLPQIVSGNTNGPMMAIAWQAANMILEDVSK